MSDLDDALSALPRLGRARLQEKWRETFRAAPPAAYTPDLLARGIAYRLQEKALGRLDNALARRLLSTARGKAGSKPKQRTGNRLVRRWRGRTYVVDVMDEGFRYEASTYGSLSEIATKITGTRWSGPRFFGLPK